jgi:hypothetical protein
MPFRAQWNWDLRKSDPAATQGHSHVPTRSPTKIIGGSRFNGSGVAEHELLLAELFPAIADVMTADEWVVQLGNAT